METIIVADKKSHDFDPTIVFYNNSNKYDYSQSNDLFDSNSAVFCCPDNYEKDNLLGEATYRITFMANYDKWKALEKDEYKKEKEVVFDHSVKLLKKLNPTFDSTILFKDVFSPTTVERYTSHLDGTVYGSPDKTRDGKTEYSNLFIIGTDQGFLGIVGSMLSGISMANLHGLMDN
jgi:phytoene dehydrogenase-like protein